MIWIILFIGFILRCMGLNQSLWLDEAAQVIESLRPLKQQLDISGDFQPPLFHLLLHFWLYLGKSEIFMRLLPIFIGLLTIFVVYKLAIKTANKNIALLAAGLLAISPFHIWYSQEIRPYALSVLLGMVSTYFLINKKFFYYGISTVLFIYTIYLAPFLVLAQGMFVILFERKYLKKWIISIIIVGILFIPWLPQFIKQFNIGSSLVSSLPGWGDAVSTSTIKILALIFIKFFIGRISFDNKIIYSIIAAILFIVFCYLLFISFKKNKKLVKQMLILLVIPILAAFLVSIFIPILAPQRILFVLPIFYLLIAFGINSIEKKQIKIFIIGLITLISGYANFLYITNPRFQREQWKQAVEFVELNSAKKSLAVFIFPEAFAPWQYYNKGVVPSIGIAPKFVISQQDLMLKSDILKNADKIFLFHYLEDLTDLSKIVPKYLLELGFFETSKKDFPGVGFISIYEKYIAYN